MTRFLRYKRVGIINTSNKLSTTLDKLGISYHLIAALEHELNAASPNTLIDKLDYVASTELGITCVDDVSNADYDALIIMNHTYMFFAGTLPKSFYKMLCFINGYKGDVYWMYEHPAYFPTKTHVELIQQYGKYEYKKYNKLLNDMLLDNDFVSSLNDIDSRIQLLSDIDIGNIPNNVISKTDYSKTTYERVKNDYVRTNLAKTLGTAHPEVCIYESKKYDINLAYNYDLSRFKIASKYIDDAYLNVSSIRYDVPENVSCKKTTIPRILNIMKYYDFLETECFASLIITTKDHLQCIIPERFYGIFSSYVVGFIPLECDPKRSWIRNNELAKFSYIESTQDLVQKMQLLKDKNFYDRIILLQHKEILTI